MALQPSVASRPLFFIFVILYEVGKTPLTGDHPVITPLPTHRTAETQIKRTPTSMPRVGFEPRTPVFEREKTVHAFESVATVTGGLHIYIHVSTDSSL
jgi:hypothetical protein